MNNTLKDTPLNDIIQDPRVKSYILKKSTRLTEKKIQRYRTKQSEASSCHAWLICLHYEAINRLQKKYSLSKPEFIVLMGAYLFKQTGNNGFLIKNLSSTLLSWQYNRTYRHLRKLKEKGYI